LRRAIGSWLLSGFAAHRRDRRAFFRKEQKRHENIDIGRGRARHVSYFIQLTITGFNHTDAPLNRTAAQIENQFPHCQLSHGPNYLRNVPFTGYQPVFPQLTPNYEGQYLKGVGDELCLLRF
jgi:hypothetical protein